MVIKELGFFLSFRTMKSLLILLFCNVPTLHSLLSLWFPEYESFQKVIRFLHRSEGVSRTGNSLGGGYKWFINPSCKNTCTFSFAFGIFKSDSHVVLQSKKNGRLIYIWIRKWAVNLCILGIIWLQKGYRHMGLAFLIVFWFFCLAMWYAEIWKSLTYLGPCKHLDGVGRAIMVHQNLTSICYILPLVSQDCIMGSGFVNLYSNLFITSGFDWHGSSCDWGLD